MKKQSSFPASFLACLSLLAASSATAQNYTWSPDGTASGTAGGSGTWANSSLVWWNGSQAIGGTPIGVGGQVNITFNGSGTITKAGQTFFVDNSASASPHTLAFAPGGHYAFIGAGGDMDQINTGVSHFTFNVAASSTLTFGGDGAYLGLMVGTNVTAGPGLIFGGGGQVDFRSGAMIRPSHFHGRATIRDGTTVTFYENSLFAGLNETHTTTRTGLIRIAIESGAIVVNGGRLSTGYGGSSDAITRGFGIAIGITNDATGSFTLNSGTVLALGDPRNASTAQYAGILFGYNTTNLGGRVDLNGGTLIVSNIRTRTSTVATLNAILNLNGVTLIPSTAVGNYNGDSNITNQQLQDRLDLFINGFANTDVSHVILGPGGVIIDTSQIDASRTNGVATINSVMRGTGNLTLTGPNTLRLINPNTFTGDTIVLSGTLRLGRADAVAYSGNVSIASGATILTQNTGEAGTYYNQTLNNLAGAGALLTGPAAITLNNTADTAFTGNFAGTGALSKTGSASLDLTAVPSLQSYSAIAIADGVLLGNAAALDTGISIAASARLVLHQAAGATAIRTHAITGSGEIMKTGAGALILDAATTAGMLTIAEGSLLLANNTTLTAAGIVAQANTSFGGHGAVTGSTSLSNATLQVGDTTLSTLSLAGDIALDHATLNFHLIDATNSTRLLHSGGTFAFDPATTINITSALSGTYNLGNIGALASAALYVNGQQANARQGGVLSNVGGDLILETANDHSRYLTWSPAGSGDWNVIDPNWTSSGSALQFASGDSITINNATAGAVITIETGVVISDLNIRADANLTLAGAPVTTNTTSYAPGEIVNPAGRLVKTGAATLTLSNTAANYFAGGIDLREGVLAFTTNAQLASGGDGITFASSGTLRPAADGIVMTPVLTVPAAVSAAIDTAGRVLTHAGRIVSDVSGTLVKTGAGTLAIDLSAADLSAHAGAIHIKQGALALHTPAQFTGTVWDTPITGPGNLEKTGAGTAVLIRQPSNTGATIITAGTLRAGAANIFNPASAHTVSAGAILDLGGYDQAVGSLHNSGAIAFTARVNNTTALITHAQALTVNGDASGNGTILVTLTESPSDETAGTPTRPLILVNGDSAAANYTAVLDRRYIIGNYDWQVTRDHGIFSLGRDLSPEIPAIGAADAAVTLGSQAAYAALSQRLSSRQLITHPQPRTGSNFWFNPLYQRDKITTSLYEGATADTWLAQVGYDYAGDNNTFAVGIAVDYARTSVDLPARATSPTSDTDLYGLNLYFTHQPGPWYFNLLVRLNNAATRAEIPDTPALDIDSTGLGASFEIGLNWASSSGWLVQPQVQYIYQSISTDPITDSFGRTYKVGNTNTNNLRAGLLISKVFRPRHGRWAFHPYVRASYVNEFSGMTLIKSDATNTGPTDYESDLGGVSALINAGAVLRLSETLGVSADFSSLSDGPVKRYAVNLGVSLRW